jgi:hypothetical protein
MFKWFINLFKGFKSKIRDIAEEVSDLCKKALDLLEDDRIDDARDIIKEIKTYADIAKKI